MSEHVKSNNNQVSSSTYEELEQEVDQLNQIENWEDRVVKMKELKLKIKDQQEKLGDLIGQIVSDDLPNSNIKKKKKPDLEKLIGEFNSTDSLEEKIKLFQMINYHIGNIEKELFADD